MSWKIVLAKKFAALSDEDRKDVLAFARELPGKKVAVKKPAKKRRKRRTKAEMAAAREAAGK